jgi:hypothetical protein
VTVVVNGETVNAAYHLEQPDPARPEAFIPLTRGRLGFQLYQSELWIRRVAVRAL